MPATYEVTREKWLLVDFFENPAFVQRTLRELRDSRRDVPSVTFDELLERRQAYLATKGVSSRIA